MDDLEIKIAITYKVPENNLTLNGLLRGLEHNRDEIMRTIRGRILEALEEKAQIEVPEKAKRPEPVKPEKPLPEIVPRPKIPSVQDRGPSQHRYFQVLIKRIAADKGYKATIEQPTPDGAGRIDVALERNGKRIAC